MLFLDTSALVFLYVDSQSIQQGDLSARVRAAVEQKGTVACSALALPEAAAAFTQLSRSGLIRPKQAEESYSSLLEDWPTAYRVPLNSQLALEASALARSRNLRGADAVQLASGAMLSREVKGVEFLTFDEQLNEAAKGLVRLWGE